MGLTGWLISYEKNPLAYWTLYYQNAGLRLREVGKFFPVNMAPLREVLKQK